MHFSRSLAPRGEGRRGGKAFFVASVVIPFRMAHVSEGNQPLIYLTFKIRREIKQKAVTY